MKKHTLRSLIAAKEQERAEMTAARSESPHARTIDAAVSACLADQRDPSDAEANQVRGAIAGLAPIDAKIRELDAELAELRAAQSEDEAYMRLASEFHPTGESRSHDAPERNMSTTAHITNEPRTYARHLDESGERSFFVDAFKAERGDLGARQRIERHAREVEVDGIQTERATTTGSFAGLVVPQYLVDQAALVARASRPYANSVMTMQIPDAGMSFLVPKGTTGASAGVQATENTSVSSTDEVWSNITCPVATIAGQQDVSRQSIERGTPGLDALIYMDLAGAYGVALDQQVLSGSGSSGQVLGVLNTAGISAATAYGAVITPALFQRKIAGAINSIIGGRFLGPTHIAVTPRRFAWLVSAVDSQNRPLFTPNANGPVNVQGTFDAADYGVDVGKFMGLRVVVDASIPTAGTLSEDQCIIYRAPDQLLWEDGDGMPRELRFEQTLGNQLTVKLVVYGYVAFTAARYPLSTALTGGADVTAGNGQIAPVF